MLLFTARVKCLSEIVKLTKSRPTLLDDRQADRPLDLINNAPSTSHLNPVDLVNNNQGHLVVPILAPPLS